MARWRIGHVAWRTVMQTYNDNCLSMAAALSYYLFFALFPALLFVIALTSYLPLNVADHMLLSLGHVAPGELYTIVSQQAQHILARKNVGVLTVGFAVALWSSSTAAASVIGTINQAFDLRQTRNWFQHQLLAVFILIVLTVFGIVAVALIVAGPEIAARIAGAVGLGGVFERAWAVGRWPVSFVLAVIAFAIVYRLAPDVRPYRVVPGAVVGTLLWLGFSEGFRVYLTHFANYNATYGAIAGAIVALTWLYLSALALLVGAELNSAIEHSVDRQPTAVQQAADRT